MPINPPSRAPNISLPPAPADTAWMGWKIYDETPPRYPIRQALLVRPHKTQ
jgi:hypothetical protein